MINNKTGTGTALVVVERASESANGTFKVSRPDAPFITQLIATAAGAAQTRELRRAAQTDALKDYRTASAQRIDLLKPNGDWISRVA